MKIMSRTPREEHELYQAVQRDAAAEQRMEQRTAEGVMQTQEGGFWQFAAAIVVFGLLFGWWGNRDTLFSSSYSTVQQYHRCAMQQRDTDYIMHCMSVAGYRIDGETCMNLGHNIKSEDEGINKCFVYDSWWSDVKAWWRRAEERRQAREAAEQAAKAAKESEKVAKRAAYSQATRDTFVQEYRRCEAKGDKVEEKQAGSVIWNCMHVAGLDLNRPCLKQHGDAGDDGDSILRQCGYKLEDELESER
jgi:hypothetical protein